MIARDRRKPILKQGADMSHRAIITKFSMPVVCPAQWVHRNVCTSVLTIRLLTMSNSIGPRIAITKSAYDLVLNTCSLAAVRLEKTADPARPMRQDTRVHIGQLKY